MRLVENLPKYFVIGFFGIGLVALLVKTFVPDTANTTTAIRLPELSKDARAGEALFNGNCAACHGENGAGTEGGPPLVHDIYNPGHHTDGSFYSAMKNGVKRHHWPFGNMPPQKQVAQYEAELIVRYVRELQVANGITYKPHNM